MKKILVSILVALPLAAAAYVSPGKPSGFVNDFAGILKPSERQELEARISAFEKATSDEISVVTIKDLGGDTIENYAVKLFEEWKIGKAGKDNGVLILVALDDRQMRIEVGYGLEGDLTDLQSSWIINRVMVPAFQTGDYFGGLSGAVEKVEAAVGGEAIPSEQPEPALPANLANISWFFIIAFIFFFRIAAILLGRSPSWWAGGVLGAVGAGVASLFLGSFVLLFLVLVPVGLLFDFLVSRSYGRARVRGVLPWWWFIGRGGGHGGGGGFGGFGGGRSGGGGSSGRW